MVMVYNVLGYFTLIYGFMGLFSLSVPKGLAFAAMITGGASMFMSFSRSRVKAVEPLAHAVLLLGVAICAIAFHARNWFPAIGFTLAAIQFLAAGVVISRATHHSHGMEMPPFMTRRAAVNSRQMRM